MIRQRPVKGGRKQVSGGVIKAIERKIEADMRRFDCGRAFVVSTALAIFYNVDVEKFYEREKKSRRRNKSEVIQFRKRA